MMKSKSFFRKWFTFERIIPLLTAVSAFLVDFLGLVGIIELTIVEGVFLWVLGLLAVDALVERLGILSRIENTIERDVNHEIREILISLEQATQDIVYLKNQIIFEHALTWEDKLLQTVPLKDYIKHSKELFVSGGHLYNLLYRQREVLSDWLKLNQDATLKLILENPNAAVINKTPISSSEFDPKRVTYADEINISLRIVTEILAKKFPGRIEIRLTDEVPGFTVMIVDRVKARVFFNLYKGGPEKRPVVEIIKSQLPDLFNLFDDRYRDQLWEASEPYDTLSSSSKDAPHPL